MAVTTNNNIIARFPFVDWAKLLEASHSMSKSNSLQEKLVKKHARTHNLAADYLAHSCRFGLILG